MTDDAEADRDLGERREKALPGATSLDTKYYRPLFTAALTLAYQAFGGHPFGNRVLSRCIALAPQDSGWQTLLDRIPQDRPCQRSGL